MNGLRISKYPVLPVLLNRFSARAIADEPVLEAELMTLFEAASWAPSSYNNQPWRFIYGYKGTPEWQTLYELLVPFNQSWAGNASVLVLVVSHTLFEFNNKPSRTHSFDTGAACENLAIQGVSMGLVVHAMEGFDYEKARVVCQVPKEYTVEAVFAIGKPGKIENLPQDMAQRETLSQRKPLEQIVMHGTYKTL
jgi:nitroreductase